MEQVNGGYKLVTEEEVTDEVIYRYGDYFRGMMKNIPGCTIDKILEYSFVLGFPEVVRQPFLCAENKGQGIDYWVTIQKAILHGSTKGEWVGRG